MGMEMSDEALLLCFMALYPGLQEGITHQSYEFKNFRGC